MLLTQVLIHDFFTRTTDNTIVVKNRHREWHVFECGSIYVSMCLFDKKLRSKKLRNLHIAHMHAMSPRLPEGPLLDYIINQ